MADGAGVGPRRDAERLNVAMAVAALEGLVGTHQREADGVVVEAVDCPSRLAVADVAVAADRTLMIVGVTAGAIATSPQELPVGMACHAADALMEGKETLGRMLEFDFREWMAGRMAGFALADELGVVRGRMAGLTIGFGLLLPVAGFAGQFGVASFEGESGGDMLLDIVRGRFFLRLDFLVELDRQGPGPAAGQEKK